MIGQHLVILYPQESFYAPKINKIVHFRKLYLLSTYNLMDTIKTNECVCLGKASILIGIFLKKPLRETRERPCPSYRVSLRFHCMLTKIIRCDAICEPYYMEQKAMHFMGMNSMRVLITVLSWKNVKCQ